MNDNILIPHSTESSLGSLDENPPKIVQQSSNTTQHPAHRYDGVNNSDNNNNLCMRITQPAPGKRDRREKTFRRINAAK